MDDTELKITINPKVVKKIFNPKYIILILFVITTILFVNLDKVPLTHPGNIKAADPFTHSMMGEDIIETKQWNYYNTVYSLNRKKEVNAQPPLWYLNSAILTQFSGVPIWVTIYFLVCLAQAFFVIIVYLITKEIFENEKIALISGGLSMLPLPLNAWLYALYVGMWIQVPAYFLLMAFIWIFIRFLKKRESWTLFFMGIIISSVVLIHPTDIMLLFIPSVIVGIIVFFEQILIKKNIIEFIKQTLLILVIPLITIYSMLPRFLIVWKTNSGANYGFGYYGLNNYFSTLMNNSVLRLVFPPFSHFSTSHIVLFTFGIILLIISILIPYNIFLEAKNKKVKILGKKVGNYNKIIWFCFTLYYFALIYLTEVVLYQPYFIGRMRALQPFIIYPTIAFLIYSVIQLIRLFIQYYFLSTGERKTEGSLNIINIIGVFFVIIFVIMNAMPQYKNLQSGLQYENLPLNEWNAYKWLQSNTNNSDFVLFFGSVFQAESIYSKRIHAVFPMEDMQRAINQYIATNKTVTQFNGGWGGNTPRTNFEEVSFWKYNRRKEPDLNFSIFMFDYIFFQDVNEQIANVNDVFAKSYIDEFGFKIVYDNQGYMILKNENKKTISKV